MVKGESQAKTRLSVLGPVDLSVDGAAVRLPSRLERAVLATLALRSGRPVTREALARSLWGDEPPDGWRHNLNVTVSRLRRRLAAAAGGQARDLVQTVPDGYRLALTADQVDVARFERLVAEASRALSGADPVAAEAATTEALGLWWDDPLPELADTMVGRAEASRLLELHDVAVDVHLDARLALGDHAAVVALLERGLADDPLRERGWAKLMLGLYRAGRPADALRAFQRARAVLDEVGLVPAPVLRRMEEAILRHDAVLTVGSLDDVDAALTSGRGVGESGPGAPPLAEGSASPPDRPLPPAARGLRHPFEDHFTGRHWVDRQREVPLVSRRDEMARLAAAWSGVNAGHTTGLVFLDGDPGTGKTRLAAELADEVTATGGRVVRAACAPGAGLSALVPAVRSLGLHPPSDLGPGSTQLLELALEVTRHLVLGEGQPPTLLVLDDAQYVDEATMTLFGVLGDVPLPPPRSNVILVLVLTQRGFDPVPGLARLVANVQRLAWHDRIEVGPLGETDARALVDRVARDEADPGRLEEIVRCASGNPHALIELARAVADPRAGAQPGDPPPPALQAAYDERLGRQSPEVLEVVLAAAVLGPEVTVDDLVVVAGRSERPTMAALERAVARRLLDEVPGVPGGFRFPSLLEHRLALDRVSPARRARLEEKRPSPGP